MLSCTGTLATTLGLDQPFRYRGYVYDTETGWYYLQSRYYDPSIGRFISADVLLSTGQGVLGHNSFAYCLGNPVCRSDSGGAISYGAIAVNDGWGSDDDIYKYQQAKLVAIAKPIVYLVRNYTVQHIAIGDEYLEISIGEWDKELYNAVNILGVDAVASIMANTACNIYLNETGKAFPLENPYVAYEIEYHIDGYFYGIGHDEYFFRRNITTWIFKRGKLINHCVTIEIDYSDKDERCLSIPYLQALLFKYRDGTRDSYK